VTVYAAINTTSGQAVTLQAVGNVPNYANGVSVACTASGLVAIQTSTLTTVAMVNASAKTITALSSMVPVNAFAGVTAFVSNSMPYLVPYESNNVIFYILNGINGRLLSTLNSASSGSQGNRGLQVSHDRTTSVVMFTGIDTILGISFASPLAPALLFRAAVTTGNAELSAGRATVALANDYLVSFSTTANRTWSVPSQILSVMNIAGVTYYAHPGGLTALGATGNTLWSTVYKLPVTAGAIQGPGPAG
jgi:hypothetical protein